MKPEMFLPLRVNKANHAYELLAVNNAFVLADVLRPAPRTAQPMSDADTRLAAHYIAGAANSHADLLALLERNLVAWEDEEESVKEEHAELIDDNRALLQRISKGAARSASIASSKLPSDPDDLNEDRAGWASAALDSFMAQTGQNDRSESLQDLICNLLHLAQRLNLDPESVIASAQAHHREETRAA